MMPSVRTSYVFLIVAALVALMSFMITGPYNMRIDGQIYVEQVLQFEQGAPALEPFDVALRAFKPFHGIWGALLVPVFTPMEALQLLNMFLLLGFPFVAYFFLREFGFGDREATWGTVWIVTGYPVLKYGLAIGTDLGGWFFGVLTAGLFLRGMRTNSMRMLAVGSVCGFIGGTIKEPGLVGLIFGGLILLFSLRELGVREFSRCMFWFAFPAFMLESVLMFILARLGLPSFFDWFSHVHTAENIREQYQLFKWFGVEASAFHILWIFAIIGFFSVFMVRSSGISWARTKIIALIIAVSPVLLWVFIISRILYIQFMFMVPLALIGLSYIFTRFPRFPTWVQIGVYGAPIIVSVTLYALAGTGSLFAVFR